MTLLRCAVCGTEVAARAIWPWRCPRASSEDRHHVLHRVPSPGPLRPNDDQHPFIRFDIALTWARLAQEHGMGFDGRVALIREVDSLIANVDGTGFFCTPFSRHDSLSEAFGFSEAGGIWLKDETVDVAGSAKARHLFSILLHLIAMERVGVRQDRPPLAIASCGNAALAAATLAAAVRWTIEVFVPTDANPVVVAKLRALGGSINVCERRGEDPPGDPCIHRFRDAVDDGAIPFSVQGPENALCLDGGRTIMWECIELFGRFGLRLDRVFAQVGGGALATSLGQASHDAGVNPRLHVVQTEGCAPLARAWQRWRHDSTGGWSDYMWPWETTPTSAATGILDDETYDWLGIVPCLRDSNGSVVIATEEDVARANDLVREHTPINADHTGTAALAGVLAMRGHIGDDEVILVPITGVQRER